MTVPAVPDAALGAVDRLIDQAMDDMGIPGMAVTVTDRDRLLMDSVYGVADVASATPVTRDTLFEIGSLGKVFMVIVLLQLRDEGKLDLSAPVAQYLPWFQVQSVHPPIAVHHLLNHTAGIVRGTDIAPHGLYECWSLRDRATGAPPGTYFSYSNVGYKTLGFLAERLTGQSLPDLVRSRVFQPLGMTRSRAAITAGSRGLTATGHTSAFDDRPEHRSHRLVPATWSEYAAGDGAQVSNASDMATYLRMLLNRGAGPSQRLVSEDGFGLMTENGVWTGCDHYAYGLVTYQADGRPYIGHGGGNAGFRSALMADMNAGLGVVLLANRTGDSDAIVALAQRVLTAVRCVVADGVDPQPPEKPDPTVIPDASDFAGVYRCADKLLELTARDGNLLLCLADETIALERRGRDSFYVCHPDFALSLLDFGRQSGRVVEAFHGSDWYVGEGYAGREQFDHPDAWNAYVGHYRARNPELSNFRVAIRKSDLVLLNPWGNVDRLVPLGENLFRIGSEPRSPETLRFDAVVEGRALVADYSGCPYYRTFTA